MSCQGHGTGRQRPDDFPGPECAACLELNVHTPVERWKKTPMRYCTLHYWLMRGSYGYTLDAYSDRSRFFGFILSFPSPDESAKITGAVVPAITAHSAHP